MPVPAHISQDSESERPMASKSRKHSKQAHFQMTEIAKYACEQKLQGLLAEDALAKAVPRAEKFGDLITADRKVLDEEGESRSSHQYAVVVQDLATRWIQLYPCKTQNFLGDRKEFTKVSRAVTEAESQLHWQFIGVWQSL